MDFLPEPKDSKKNKEEGLFSSLGNLLSWVAERITLQAKIDTQATKPLASKKINPLSGEKKRKELTSTLEKTLETLFRFKEMLCSEFGSEARNFVLKSLDPLIESAQKYLTQGQDADEEKEDGSSHGLSLQAVQSVEFYSQIKDEKKLLQKIIHDADTATKQALEKDFQILRNYQYHALEEVNSEQELLQLVLDKKLQAVFEELAALLRLTAPSDDLKKFFLWKKDVDNKRSALVELGLLTIDSVLHKTKKQEKNTPDEKASSIDELSNLEEVLILRSYELVKLASLEERALKIFELLENKHACNHNVVGQIEHLLLELKEEAESYNNISLVQEEERAVLEGSFQDLYESILKAEKLLETRKREI